MEFEIETIRGRQFRDERVVLDGREFVGCTFEGCQLVYCGGPPFIITGNHAALDIGFEGPAANTLNCLAGMHQFGMHALVEEIIASIRNPLGGTLN